MVGVYGGVAMDLAAVGRVPVGRVPTAKVSVSRAPALSQRLISSRAGLSEMSLQIPGAAPGVPKGVDLNLDKFELATTTEGEPQVPEGSWGGEEFIGRAFWKNLSGTAFREEDKSLLQALYNPHMSDRREDCELFVPPDTGLAHVSKLRELLKEEAAVQKQRKEHFLSKDFDPEDAGFLFTLWKPAVAVASSAPRGEFHARPELVADFPAVPKTAPTFDKTTEDGTRFRVYQVGSLEVRTTQEPGSEEAVGGVFSTRAPAQAHNSVDGSWSIVAKTDKIVKAVMYVEADASSESKARGDPARHYYTVLETNYGESIVAEQLHDGTFAWVEGPADLESRSSNAKVIRAVKAADVNLTVREMKRRLSEEGKQASEASAAERRRYAHGVLFHVLPAREKVWAVLGEEDRLSMAQLGVSDAKSWDERTAGVFGVEWESLTEKQLSAAQVLGFSKVTWRNCKKVEPAAGPEQKSWEQLTEKEQEAKMEEWVKQNFRARSVQ